MKMKGFTLAEVLITLGIIGGVKVPFLKPSQLKPSNHLKKENVDS